MPGAVVSEDRSSGCCYINSDTVNCIRSPSRSPTSLLQIGTAMPHNLSRRSSSHLACFVRLLGSGRHEAFTGTFSTPVLSQIEDLYRAISSTAVEQQLHLQPSTLLSNSLACAIPVTTRLSTNGNVQGEVDLSSKMSDGRHTAQAIGRQGEAGRPVVPQRVSVVAHLQDRTILELHQQTQMPLGWDTSMSGVELIAPSGWPVKKWSRDRRYARQAR